MKKSIFLFFAAILCAMTANAWGYKTAAGSWNDCNGSESKFTNVTMNSGTTLDVVMLKDVGDGLNILQNQCGGQALYCKWTKASGDIFRGTARWNNGLYCDETVVIPEGKVYIKVGSGEQVQMTAGADYTYTADVTISTTGESYTISGETVNGATINNESDMPAGGKPSTLTMSNLYTSKNSGSVHIVFDLKTNKVTETAETPTEPEPDPTPEPVETETIYFVNAEDWTGTINVYAWTDSPKVENAVWPGAAATKETNQIAGHDVYSFTAEKGKFAKVIFNNNNGKQTGDLAWTAGQYICKNEWCADEAAVLAKLTGPVEYESVYFINVKNWTAVNIYTWSPEIGTWPGKAMTKEENQIAGYDVYSYTVEKGTTFGGMKFNEGNGKRETGNLIWATGKYYVVDLGWLTKEEAEAKLAAPLPEVWNIVGAAGLMGKDWDLNATENAMTKQEDGTYKLEKKDITLTAGTYEYKAAKDHGWDVSVPSGNTNQKLTISKSGIYDVTFVLDVTAKKLTATATLKKEAVVIPTVVIAGDMNSWNQTKDKFTMAADSLTATFKATLAAKSYGFKMIVGGAWLSDGKTITRANNSTVFTGANSNNNTKITADIAGEYTFTWTYETKTLTVSYPVLPIYTVTIAAENGTVEGLAADGKYEHGTKATLTATPAEGYEFVNWTVGGKEVSAKNPYTFTVTADVALVANFAKKVYTVTIAAENGTVEGLAADGKYEHGAEATLTATPAEGYEFVNWTKGEEVVSTVNPYKFTVTADVDLVANFAKKVHTVTVAAENGTVEGLAADGKYEHGAEATLTATPAEGYQFVNWTKGEEVVSTENPYTFTVTADIALVANFKKSVVTHDFYVEDVNVTKTEWSIDLAGSWNEQAFVLKLWQDNTQGFGTYAANAETGYSAVLGVKELTPTAEGYYMQDPMNKNAFIFQGTMTDGADIYEVYLKGALASESETGEMEAKTEVTFSCDADGVWSIEAFADDYSWGLTLEVVPNLETGEYVATGYYVTDIEAGVTEEVAGTGMLYFDDFSGCQVFKGNLTTESGNIYPTLYASSLDLITNEIMTGPSWIGEIAGVDYYEVLLMANNDLWELDLHARNCTGDPGTYTVDIVDVEEGAYSTFMGTSAVTGELTINEDNSYEAYVTTVDADGNPAMSISLSAWEAEAAEYDVVITNATVTENTSGYYIDMTGEWDGHTIKVEVCDELDTETIRANFFIDGGIANDGDQAEGTVEATVNEGVVTITGTFECLGSGAVYNVTISGTLPGGTTTSLDNLNTNVAPVKMIENDQLIIVKDGVQYNAQGAVIK